MLYIVIGLVAITFINIFIAKLFDREEKSKKLSSLKSCVISFLFILLLVNKNLNTEMVFAYLIVEFIFYFINYYTLQNTNNRINKKKLLLIIALIFFSIIFTGIQLSISIPHYNDIIETKLNKNEVGQRRNNKLELEKKEVGQRIRQNLGLDKEEVGQRIMRNLGLDTTTKNDIQTELIIPVIIYALITTLLLDIIIYIKVSKRIDKKSHNQIINDKTANDKTADWQDFLEKNFKATGTRTNMNDLRLKK